MYQRFSALLMVCFTVMSQPLKAFAQTQAPTAPQPPQWYGPGPGWMWGDGYGWQFWWICPLMMLFMIAVFAAIFFFIIRQPSSGGLHGWELPWRAHGHSALQILSERFARGEIQKDEYEQKKATILSGGQY